MQLKDDNYNNSIIEHIRASVCICVCACVPLCMCEVKCMCETNNKPLYFIGHCWDESSSLWIQSEQAFATNWNNRSIKQTTLK